MIYGTTRTRVNSDPFQRELTVVRLSLSLSVITVIMAVQLRLLARQARSGLAAAMSTNTVSFFRRADFLRRF